ncbi:MAG: hypothetical protein EB084_20860, partial [Proteobacteria bacterium]|nr:hypothetical protein [Pseudomonadota bacterium]
MRDEQARPRPDEAPTVSRAWLALVSVLLAAIVGLSAVLAMSTVAPKTPVQPPPGSRPSNTEATDVETAEPVADLAAPSDVSQAILTAQVAPSAAPAPSSHRPGPSGAVSRETASQTPAQATPETAQVASAAPVASTLLGPPDAARVVADAGRVPLGWQSGASRAWRVDVLAAGRPWRSITSTVPVVTVDAPPGPVYQWRVTSLTNGESTPWCTFQTAEPAICDVRGREGAPGRDGGSFGESGGPGEGGGDAWEVDVWVERLDGWVRVRVES